MTKLVIIAVSCMTVLTSVVGPAEAHPTVSLQNIEASDVQLVRDRGHWDDHRTIRRHHYRDDRRHGYHGRHSYRDHHHTHRDRHHHHNNAGAIIGGLAAGAIIGGIIATQPRAYSGSGYR